MAISAPQDRVLVSTRIVSAAIAPFLVAAFLVLFPWPGDTRHWFAWEIKPTMSPMVLGAVYLGGAYFFVRALRAAKWHTVAGGFVSVATFAALMGVATILHWNRFIHSNVAFWLWVALYFTTPFIVLAVFLRNRREYLRAEAGDLIISPATAAVLMTGGAAAVLMSAFLFLLPYRAIDIWPWKLSVLTARMLGAIFALGLAGLGAYWERRWSAARILLQVEAFMLVLILIAATRAHGEFDTGNVLTWLFAIGFAGTAVSTAALYVRMELRARNHSAITGPA